MHSYTPIKLISPTRRDRDQNRGRAAFARVKAETGSARLAALSYIEATFNRGTGPHSRFKDSVARFMKLGAAHPETKAMFGAYARAFSIRPATFDWCLSTLDCAWAKNRAIMRRHNWRQDGAIRDHEPRPIAEARLIMRYLRRTYRTHHWKDILDTVSEPMERREVRTVFITERHLQAAE